MEVIKIKDEFGKDVSLEIIEVFKIDASEYAIVSPVGSEEAYAYRTFLNNGEREFESIGDGKEFEKVLEKYNSMHEE
jgi:hypothetical protein